MFNLQIIKEQCGFLNEEQISEFAKEYPAIRMLVRCGGGRFICTADSVEHFCKIVKEPKLDHVRDVSVTSDEYLKFFPGSL